MIFGSRKDKPEPAASGANLEALVRAQLPSADAETQALVASIAGLLACVAFADRSYSDAEQAHVSDVVGRIHGLPATGANAICSALREHGRAIAVGNSHQYTRELRERCDREMRVEVLDALVDLAAADDELAMSETDLLRRMTSALGLTSDDYLAAQSRHKQRLSVLK